MRTYRILEVDTVIHAYDIDAESEQEALEKINASCGVETDDIGRISEYDDTISRDYQCEGEVK